MQSRRRPVYQVCALVLLLWTAMDLTNVGLCALDGEPIGPVTTSATVHAEPGTGLPEAPAPHIDDCFCCSRCVEASPMMPPGGVDWVAHLPSPLRAPLPFADLTPLYHPPQFLS